MRRQYTVAAVVCTVVAAVVLVMFFHPVVILTDAAYTSTPYRKVVVHGEWTRLRELLSENSGRHCEMYIILDREDRNRLPRGIRNHAVLRTTDPQVIGEFLDMKFRMTGADIATVESRLILYSDEELVLCSAISLDSTSIGVQNTSTGWAVPADREKFIAICKKFDTYVVPVAVF